MYPIGINYHFCCTGIITGILSFQTIHSLTANTRFRDQSRPHYIHTRQLKPDLLTWTKPEVWVTGQIKSNSQGPLLSPSIKKQSQFILDYQRDVINTADLQPIRALKRE